MADTMAFRSILIALLLAQAGCTSLPTGANLASPCATGEASMECQVERYNNVSVD